MPTLTTIGYFDPATGPAGVNIAESSSLIRLRDAAIAFDNWRATLRDLCEFLAGQIDVPGPWGFLLNVSRAEAMAYVIYFLNTSELEFEFGLSLQANRPHPHRDQNIHDARLYKDDVLERMWDRRLIGTKKRKRGVFIPGARKSRNRNAQFMRLRVPHK